MQDYKLQSKFNILLIVISFLVGTAYFILGYQNSLAINLYFAYSSIIILGLFLFSILLKINCSFAEKKDKEENEKELSLQEQRLFEEAQVVGRFATLYKQFERYIIPITTLLLSIVQLGIAYFFVPSFKEGDIVSNQVYLYGASIAIVVVIISFMLSKYLAFIAYEKEQIYLKVLANYFGILMTVNIVVFLNSCFLYFNSDFLTNFSKYFLMAILGLLILERLFNYVGELYRANTAKFTLIYDSRIFSLFVQPKGVLENLKNMISYQFGIDVQANLIKSFFVRVLLPFIALCLIIYFIFSFILFVPSNKVALVEDVLQGKLLIKEEGLFLKKSFLSKVVFLDKNKIHRQEIRLSDYLEKDKVSYLADNAKQNFVYPLALQSKVKKGLLYPSVANLAVVYKVADYNKFYTNYENPQEDIINNASLLASEMLLTFDFNILLKDEEKYCNLLQQKLSNRLQLMGVDIVDVYFTKLQHNPKLIEFYSKQLKVEQENQQKVLQAKKEIDKLEQENLIKTLAIDLERYEKKQQNLSSKKKQDIFDLKKQVFLKDREFFKQMSFVESYNLVPAETKKYLLSGENSNIKFKFDNDDLELINQGKY